MYATHGNNVEWRGASAETLLGREPSALLGVERDAPFGGERDGKEAVCVVFGATSSDARYVDTRNLFRWYWRDVMK